MQPGWAPSIRPDSTTAEILAHVHRASAKAAAAPGALWSETADFIAENRRAKGTTTTYESSRRSFWKFCKENNEVPFPAAAATVANYVRTMAVDSHRQASTIEGHLSAIKEQYTLAQMPSPTDDPIVRAAIAAARTVATKPKKRATPIEVMHIEQMILEADTSVAKDVRDITMIVLGFLAFMRRSEITRLRAEDVQIADYPTEGEVVVLRVIRSKVDEKRRHGDTILLGAQPNSPLNPVFWVRKWQEMRVEEADTFFHSLSKNDVGAKLSDNTITHVLKARSKDIDGVDAEKTFSSHSLRSGGVSAAAARGVADRLLKAHGGWVSDAVYLYIADSVQQRFSIVKEILGAAEPAPKLLGSMAP